MGDDVLDLPVLARVGLSCAPADAVPDVRSRVHWVSELRGGEGAIREFVDLVLRVQGQLGRIAGELSAGAPIAPCSPLPASGARERRRADGPAHRRARRAADRPGRRQGLGALQAPGRPLDRSPQGARVSALHAGPQLPGRQSARSRDRRDQPGRQDRSRRARDPHDSRQPVPRKRPGRARRADPSAAAAAPAAAAARTYLRPALSRPRLQARRASSIARSCRSTRCCGSIRATNTRCSTSNGSTKISISGKKRARFASGSRRSCARACRRGIRRFRPSSKTSSACRRADAAISADATRAFQDGDRSRFARRAGVSQSWRRHARARRPERRRGDLGEADGRGARARLSRVRPAGSGLHGAGRAGAVRSALPRADCRKSAGLARPSGARASSARQGPAGSRGGTAARSARAQPARGDHSSDHLGTPCWSWDCRRRWSAAISSISREAVFYSDPHICIRCRYRSNELLWQCPHCHEWNTFVEERIAPAQDGEEAEG